jgi:hypothetical protein
MHIKNFDFLHEFEFICKKEYAIMGPRQIFNEKKTEGIKSRATVPLREADF